MTEKKNFLPLGSVVKLQKAVKTVLVIQRAVQVPKEDELVYFDYGAVLYPEGMLDDKIIYFNQEDILEIVFEGYSNDDDKLVVKELDRLIKQLEEEKNQPPHNPWEEN